MRLLHKSLVLPWHSVPRHMQSWNFETEEGQGKTMPFLTILWSLGSMLPQSMLSFLILTLPAGRVSPWPILELDLRSHIHWLEHFTGHYKVHVPTALTQDVQNMNLFCFFLAGGQMVVLILPICLQKEKPSLFIPKSKAFYGLVPRKEGVLSGCHSVPFVNQVSCIPRL